MIANLEDTLELMDEATISFEDLIEKDGAELIAETRVMIGDATRAVTSINAITENDLPGIVADIRTATATANRVVEKVGNDLSNASGRIDMLTATADVTLKTVTETFASANETLNAVNSALVVGEDALGAAQRAFDGADRVINDDVSGITADLRTAIAKLNGAIDQVLGRYSGRLRRSARREPAPPSRPLPNCSAWSAARGARSRICNHRIAALQSAGAGDAHPDRQSRQAYHQHPARSCPVLPEQVDP